MPGGRHKLATDFSAVYASPDLYQAEGGEEFQEYVSEVTQRCLAMLRERAEGEGKTIDWDTLTLKTSAEQNNWVLTAHVYAYKDSENAMQKQRENSARRDVERKRWTAEHAVPPIPTED